MNNNIIKDKKHIHFIGIGGAGMFPLAQILHSKGYFITGSDNNETDTLKLVRDMGIKVFLGHQKENIMGADLIVHTAAIMEDNIELIAANNSSATVIGRSILLGIINNSYKNSICVSGTHGKTTVTAMITQILMSNKKDPTCIIGGRLKSIGGNGRVGHSDLMVCEACEFRDTFLQLLPHTAVVLNIDNDHMEYFKTMDNLINSFVKFSNNTTGRLIVNNDDKNCDELRNRLYDNKKLKIITVGKDNTADYFYTNHQVHKGIHQSFTFSTKEKEFGTVEIFVAGEHNVYNATVAIATLLDLGITFDECVIGLKDFFGSGRRFEVLSTTKGITVVDDYAHHPEEVKVTLKAAKNLEFKRIIAVHQPFTYSRTKTLLNEFAESLKIADITVLTEIMGSREKNTYDITSNDLAEKIPNAVTFPTFEAVTNYVISIAQKGDLIITLGCGDVYKVAKMIIDKINT